MCIVVVSCVIITNLPVVASFLDKSKEPDFSVYKTFVGQTIENDFGRLTLNEVMMDDNQILLNATFEPVEDLDFDYQVFFHSTSIGEWSEFYSSEWWSDHCTN